SAANTLIVGITLLSLTLYVGFVTPDISFNRINPESTAAPFSFPGFFEAVALLFVAYTGYGRVATLGEEIVDPARNIPRAVIATLAVSFLLYFAVALASLGSVGGEEYGRVTREGAAPLEAIAHAMNHPWLARVLAIGAVTAMLGVLLNLVLGLSRVVYAMGKRNDLPDIFARVDHRGSPYIAVLACGVVIFALVLLRDVKLTWSFSAFTVLVYYALTNAASLRLPEQNRRYPRILGWIGLIACAGLSIWVDRQALLWGVGILVTGFVLRAAVRYRASTGKA